MASEHENTQTFDDTGKISERQEMTSPSALMNKTTRSQSHFGKSSANWADLGAGLGSRMGDNEMMKAINQHKIA